MKALELCIRRPVVRRALAIALVFCSLSWAIEPKRTLYVLNTKPPSLAYVDADKLQIAGDTPLAEDPTYAVLSPGNSFLYVLHNGVFRLDGSSKEGHSTLSIVDIASQKVLKTIPLGWNATKLSFSKDNRYLLCVSVGKFTKKDEPDSYGSITIVDTQTNDVAATLSAGRLGVEVALSADASMIYVLSRGDVSNKKKPIKPRLTIFRLASEDPLAELEFERASSIALSRDEKWLYVLDRGNPDKKPAKHVNAQVLVLDAATGEQVASHDAGTNARSIEVDPDRELAYLMSSSAVKKPTGRIYELRGKDMALAADLDGVPVEMRRSGSQNFLLTTHRMHFVSEDGTVAPQAVQLNSRKGMPKPEEPVSYLDGLPGEVLHLPQQNRAIMTVRNWAGVPTSKVAIVNLADNRVERVVTTGRGGVKFGKFMGAIALSVALSSLSYYAGYSMAQATGSPFFFYNTYYFTPAAPNLHLTASEDGQYAYALNTSTNDVTIFKTADGTVIDKIAVGGSQRIALTPGGRYVYSHSSGQVNLIDTHSNTKHLEHKLPNGRVHGLQVLEGNQRLVALTSKSLMLWDTGEGKLVTTIDGFHEPYQLIQPLQK